MHFTNLNYYLNSKHPAILNNEKQFSFPQDDEVVNWRDLTDEHGTQVLRDMAAYYDRWVTVRTYIFFLK